MAGFQEGAKAATLPSHCSTSVPGTGRQQRRMALCKLEDFTFDGFELLYSGAVDKMKSHKSNLNLSKSVRFQIGHFNFIALENLDVKNLCTLAGLVWYPHCTAYDRVHRGRQQFFM